MTPIQIIAITAIAFFQAFDAFATQIVPSNHIVFGFLAGLALGDWQTGLYVGASCQLMSLGVAAIGGASVPNYGIAAIMGTTFAICSNADTEAALTIGVAVAMLYIQLDVLVKIVNGFLEQWEERLCDQGKFKSMSRVMVLSPILMGLEGAIPTFIACVIGVDAINAVLDFLPYWFTGGLSIAGAALPVVGMGLLLNYMPAKKYFGCIMLGFVLATYFGMGIIPIAIIGGVWAFVTYQNQAHSAVAAADAGGTAGEIEGGGLEDE